LTTIRSMLPLKRQRQTFMSPAELIAAGELVYGSQWRKPLAEAVGYSRRMIWYYEFGERQIPEHVAICVRHLADLGPVGSLVRSSIRRAAPDLPPGRAHRIAVQILADLAGAGFLQKGDAPVSARRPLADIAFSRR
jgi:hypothetical protein